MKKYGLLFLFMSVVIFSSCERKFDEHYQADEKNVNVKLWDAVKATGKYSDFVTYVETYKLDSIVDSPNPTTLFIPGNDAFDVFLSGDTTGLYVAMKYFMVNGLFQIRTIDGQYRLQTYSEKYALIENRDNQYYFDETEITYASPLFENGKYYEIANVVEPKLSLYEYLKYYNPAFGNYIDTQDSIVLDKEKSEPLRYDEYGRTIYDSVSFILNRFEEEYFKISRESRSLSATLVLPDKQMYENALDEMASRLNNSSITSHSDIPVSWQNEVLIPNLLNKGIYGGSLEPEFFDQSKFTNVRGDSIFRDFEIDPDSRILCSNGFIYSYQNFVVGDSLFLERKVEGESLVKELGVNRYTWDEELTDVSCDNCVQPIEQEVTTASNDSVINISFPANYQGTYSVSFTMKYVFPGTYRGVLRSNYITSGVYNIYANDEKVLDHFDTRTMIDGVFSVDPSLYKLYPDKQGYNEVDFWVDVAEYGSVKFTIEYVGPGSNTTNNGLIMDYLGLFPKSN